MLKKLFNIFILIIVLLALGCDTKTSSVGEFDHIIVFCDSTLYKEIEPNLNQVFDNFIYTPHSEKSFLHKWVPLNLLENYSKRRNLIFIGLLNQNDEVSEYVRKMLSPEIQDKILKGEIFEIFRENIFSYDQMGLILCAANKQEFISNLSLQGDNIYKKFERYHFKRLNTIQFDSGEQFDIEEFLINEYGWKVRVPYSYQVVERSVDSNFVWIKRSEPSRSIFVYRAKGAKSKINEKWIIEVRDSLATAYFEGDSISVEDTYIIDTELNGISATKLVGIWQNHQQIIGGPFRTYVFTDDSTNYIYFVDISVVAPGKRKKPFLDQLEVIANTFEISKNTKK